MEFFYPAIEIRKGKRPLLFIDTFMWGKLLRFEDSLTTALNECCKDGKLTVAATSGILGELKQRNMLVQIREICGDALLSVPMGRIAANQIIQAMVCYFEKHSTVTLSWDLAVSDVPVLTAPQAELKQLAVTLERELNTAFRRHPLSKEELVAHLVGVERDIWKDTLRAYGDLLAERHDERISTGNVPMRDYEGFFLSDFFTDLPFIILSSYLFAYVMNERSIKTQDIVDIYCISELAPYCTLFILDRDQHNRLKRLQKDYPVLFDRLDKHCCISSFITTSRIRPSEALNSFLRYIKQGEANEGSY